MLVSHGGGQSFIELLSKNSFRSLSIKKNHPLPLQVDCFEFVLGQDFSWTPCWPFSAAKLPLAPNSPAFQKTNIFQVKFRQQIFFQICWQEIFYSLCVNAMSRSDQALELESPLSLAMVKKNFNVRNVLSQIKSKNYHSADGSDVSSILL